MTKEELIIKEKEIREKAKIDGITHFSSGIAIINKDKLLVLRRQIGDFLGGNYELPGGGIEQGETFFDGLTRELKEETGLDINNIVSLLKGFDYSTEIKSRVRQVNFLVTTKTHDITLSHEHDAFLWIGIDDINNLTMTAKMRECIQYIFDTSIKK